MTYWPEIDGAKVSRPKTGRGAWTPRGHRDPKDYRYKVGDGGSKVTWGLDDYAVAGGVATLQRDLIRQGYLAPSALDPMQVGGFNNVTKAALQLFQHAAKLTTDGTLGRTDAAALFRPTIYAAETAYDIPQHYVEKIIAHESGRDPGAIGTFIYYPPGAAYMTPKEMLAAIDITPVDRLEYRGVDRGLGQLNSMANSVPWVSTFDCDFVARWIARELDAIFHNYDEQFPRTATTTLWDAAILHHNNPAAAKRLLQTGTYQTPAAAAYVAAVKDAT